MNFRDASREEGVSPIDGLKKHMPSMGVIVVAARTVRIIVNPTRPTEQQLAKMCWLHTHVT